MWASLHSCQVFLDASVHPDVEGELGTAKAQRANQPFPGTIDVSSCTRLAVDVGKYSICGWRRRSGLDRSTLSSRKKLGAYF